MAPYSGGVHLDLGSGDGRGPYRWASREPSRLFVAADANAEGLLETAWRAGRKPARGGVANVVCIGEPLDVLAAELGRIADRVSVILPWGGLLRTVAAPEIDGLRNIADACLPGASVEIVFSYDCQRDTRERGPLAGIVLDERHITQGLLPAYEAAGFSTVVADAIRQQELAAYQTTWAKRLALGQARKVWRIQARYGGSL